MYRQYIYKNGENYRRNHQIDIATEARTRQAVQPRLLPRAQEGVRMRALQEYLLERQRPEETPSEKHHVPIATREEYQREAPEAATSKGDSRRISIYPSEQEEELTLTLSKLLADYVRKRQPDKFKNTSNQTGNV